MEIVFTVNSYPSCLSVQFDADDIDEKRKSINDRYQNVLVMAEERHSRLKEAITLHQFFRDIADEESWIKEKKLLVGSDDYGRDLTGKNIYIQVLHLCIIRKDDF